MEKVANGRLVLTNREHTIALKPLESGLMGTLLRYPQRALERNMQTRNLSDEQWCVLDLLMRARQKGVRRLNRQEALNSSQIPQGAAVKLTWAALTMPKDLMIWQP